MPPNLPSVAAGRRGCEIKALWNGYVPAHLLPRLTGFELMMAPYAIAYVKLGLRLGDTGYTFKTVNIGTATLVKWQASVA